MKLIEARCVRKEYGYETGKGSVRVKLVDDVGNAIKSASIYAGESEDATFYRDLDGAFNIADLVKVAYEAGKRGETLEYEFVDESEDD
ncbi:hypothetical protein MH117_09875 [Paenibacillus sp. ACRRX]|uniref:hypothetical protein n=1 Tax=Paenibacillus sp. ACRRX TaxID=2918206 RepID=UPI001EF681EE|nr:hypothetical protein [Paenibacillus sp. ACRRX]MCG7407731.1 hypothetical protein [Paenibacillus sp. ACRRX]